MIAPVRVAACWLILSTAILPGVSSAADGPDARVPRFVSAFYYPWYGTPQGDGGRAHGGRFIHWEGVDAAKQQIASSTDYPVGGAYDSYDRAVLDRHCALAKRAGIDGFIVSWWGRGSYEDGAVGPVLDACERAGLWASIYYETVAKPGTPKSAAAEIVELIHRFGNHPAFLKIRRDGQERPVLFIYGRAIQQLGTAKWAKAVQSIGRQLPAAPILIADDFSPEALRVFDGAHAYGPAGDVAAAIRQGQTASAWAAKAMPWWAATPRAAGRIACATVFPGYDDRKVRKPGLFVATEKGDLYDILWRAAVAADPDWVLVTSFNEWHEGTEIEPSAEYGESRIRQTARWSAKFHDAAGRRAPE